MNNRTVNLPPAVIGWWSRVRLRRLTALVAFSLGIAAAGVGARISQRPAEYLDEVGVVVAVDKIDAPNTEYGRDRWVKTIDVVDRSGVAWRFSYRDGREYAPGDSIEVLYDPANPAETLVTGDHEFASVWATTGLIVGFTVMWMIALMILVGEVWQRRRLRSQPGGRTPDDR